MTTHSLAVRRPNCTRLYSVCAPRCSASSADSQHGSSGFVSTSSTGLLFWKSTTTLPNPRTVHTGDPGPDAADAAPVHAEIPAPASTRTAKYDTFDPGSRPMTNAERACNISEE